MSYVCHMYSLNKNIFKFSEISRNAVECAWWSVEYQHEALPRSAEAQRIAKQWTGGGFSCWQCTCKFQEERERERRGQKREKQEKEKRRMSFVKARRNIGG